MQFDAVIQQALKDVHGLLVANITSTRDRSDERAVVCLHAVLGRASVRRDWRRPTTLPRASLFTRSSTSSISVKKRRPPSISYGGSSNNWISAPVSNKPIG